MSTQISYAPHARDGQRWILYGRTGRTSAAYGRAPDETDMACWSLESALQAAQDRGVTSVTLNCREHPSHKGLCAKYQIELAGYRRNHPNR